MRRRVAMVAIMHIGEICGPRVGDNRTLAVPQAKASTLGFVVLSRDIVSHSWSGWCTCPGQLRCVCGGGGGDSSLFVHARRGVNGMTHIRISHNI